jgi:hypothetical protein
MRTLFFWLGLLAATPAFAQITPQQETFVRSLVDAINSKSLERRRQLVHPKALQCAGLEESSFFRMSAQRQADRGVAPDYKWKISAAPAGPPPFADKFDYPVAPTHHLQLDFKTGPNSAAMVILQLAQDAGRLYEVVPCPKAETAAAMKEAAKANAAATEKAKKLAASISPQLKESILALHAQGRRLDAVKRYQEASGEDLTTSRTVVDLLTGRR